MAFWHKRYERTCRACGFQWEVSRGIAHLRPPRMKAVGQAGPSGYLNLPGQILQIHPELDSGEYESRLEVYEQARRCPSCGVDDFTQRPIR